ncbi:Gfo/Idh/MocA family protein [Christiangramia forsetii]|uniref:GFO/IDH/MocA family oxidoreductase n=2 Tax=Christiangramia forsetii TaxID=411153 RepID=A0M053_CHRFK|nr:Gfo/Idh/MocA family oxidoreductase [Christiangramia forsetii]GGG41773.1 oxidoreductase [Christiangramia forsetii]CAL65998.1 GFO/IDH/MocA family oxidoreductase [Christiangramia forsetii KT0803]
MSKIRLGILGGGEDSLIGILHRVAANMFDQFEIVGGVFDVQHDKSLKFGEKLQLDSSRIYKSLDDMIEKEAILPEDQKIQAVSILTPNFLHFPMAKQLLENGFNVICEKPLTTTYEEAKILNEILQKANTIFAVTYTYTGYPMIRQMKTMIANGEIGKIQKVDVQYYQGWINPLIHDKEKRSTTWRLDPEKSGISCCIGDIGTHAYNMAEYVTGMKVNKVLADLNYLYEDNPMDIDGTILLRFQENIKGVLRASQIATGEENNFSVKIYGDSGGLKWEQENPNYLYLLKEGMALQVLKPGHEYNSEFSLEGTKLPPGHPEGIFDSMGNIYYGVAMAIKDKSSHKGTYPKLNDGLRGMNFIEKTVDSHKQGNVWINLEE